MLVLTGKTENQFEFDARVNGSGLEKVRQFLLVSIISNDAHGILTTATLTTLMQI